MKCWESSTRLWMNILFLIIVSYCAGEIIERDAVFCNDYGAVGGFNFHNQACYYTDDDLPNDITAAKSVHGCSRLVDITLPTLLSEKEAIFVASILETIQRMDMVICVGMRHPSISNWTWIDGSALTWMPAWKHNVDPKKAGKQYWLAVKHDGVDSLVGFWDTTNDQCKELLHKLIKNADCQLTTKGGAVSICSMYANGECYRRRLMRVGAQKILNHACRSSSDCPEDEGFQWEVCPEDDPSGVVRCSDWYNKTYPPALHDLRMIYYFTMAWIGAGTVFTVGYIGFLFYKRHTKKRM